MVASFNVFLCTPVGDIRGRGPHIRNLSQIIVKPEGLIVGGAGFIVTYIVRMVYGSYLMIALIS